MKFLDSSNKVSGLMSILYECNKILKKYDKVACGIKIVYCQYIKYYLFWEIN